MSDILARVLKQAEEVQKKQEKANLPKIDGKDILKKYFIPRVADGEQSTDVTFRLLPPLEGQEVFEKAFFYSLKINGKPRKIYAVYANEKGEDPVQDLYNVLRVGDEFDKKLSNDYRPKPFWIVRGIQRGKEEEGVKFWRFSDVTKNSVFDKIYPLFKKYGDITDPDKGMDITITVTKDSNNNHNIATILPEPASKISDDAELQAALIADPITWKSIMRKEKEVTVEFLTSVALGKVPYWDDSKKTMVTPGATATATTSEPAETKVDNTFTDATDLSGDDGDLPF